MDLILHFNDYFRQERADSWTLLNNYVTLSFFICFDIFFIVCDCLLISGLVVWLIFCFVGKLLFSILDSKKKLYLT